MCHRAKKYNFLSESFGVGDYLLPTEEVGYISPAHCQVPIAQDTVFYCNLFHSDKKMQHLQPKCSSNREPVPVVPSGG